MESGPENENQGQAKSDPATQGQSARELSDELHLGVLYGPSRGAISRGLEAVFRGCDEVTGCPPAGRRDTRRDQAQGCDGSDSVGVGQSGERGAQEAVVRDRSGPQEGSCDDARKRFLKGRRWKFW